MIDLSQHFLLGHIPGYAAPPTGMYFVDLKFTWNQAQFSYLFLTLAPTSQLSINLYYSVYESL